MKVYYAIHIAVVFNFTTLKKYTRSLSDLMPLDGASPNGGGINIVRSNSRLKTSKASFLERQDALAGPEKIENKEKKSIIVVKSRNNIRNRKKKNNNTFGSPRMKSSIK